MMDLEYFGLTATPFPAVPVAANCCPYAQFADHLQTLTDSLTQSNGPGLIVGSAGTGKTMLLEVLAGRLRGHHRVIHLQDAKFSSRREFLQTLLFEMGLEYQHGDIGDLRLHLTAALRNDARLVSGVVLLIDEANLLEFEYLEQLRLLSNVVRDGRHQIQFVLAGTAQLEENLAHPALESLSQRMAARIYLSGLGLDDLFGYLDFHWRRAGGQEHPFSPEAVGAIHAATSGIPRLVNQLSVATLELGVQNQWRQFDESIIQMAWARWQQIPIPQWQGSTAGGSNRPPESNEAENSFGDVVQFGSLEDAERDDQRNAEPDAKADAETDADVDAERDAKLNAEIDAEVDAEVDAELALDAERLLPPTAGWRDTPSGPVAPSLAADEAATCAAAMAARDSTAAQQARQAETLIRFAFEADIQKPTRLGHDTDGDLPRPAAAVAATRSWADFERRIDTIQQALASTETAWDPVEEMLVEADLQALVNPVEIVSQTAEETRSQISTDPAVVFQDHLYLESLWMEDTVWTKFVQTSVAGAETLPASLPHPSLQVRPEAEALPKPAVAKPQPQSPSWVPESTAAAGAARPALGPLSEIRIDDTPSKTLSAPRGAHRRESLPTIDSPQNVSWFVDAVELSDEVRVSPVRFQDDAAIIHRRGAAADAAGGDQHVVHGPQGVDPPVMVRRKDLRALLHALRGY
jgi:type II secretory pathway predicted ATPase ExeA